MSLVLWQILQSWGGYQQGGLLSFGLWRTYTPHVEGFELCAFVTAHFLFIALGNSWLHKGKNESPNENMGIQAVMQSWIKGALWFARQKKKAISDDTEKEIGNHFSSAS